MIMMTVGCPDEARLRGIVARLRRATAGRLPAVTQKCLVVQQNLPHGLTLAESVGYHLIIMRRFVLILSSRSGT
jgi:hypothetical protein